MPDVEVIKWLVDEHPDNFPARPLGEVVAHNRNRWPEDGAVAEIVRTVAAGERLPRPIVITVPTRERAVILDGHTRLCALALMGERAPAAAPVLVGVTERAPAWSEW